MSVDIDNNMFHIEDEDLDEIEYLEILSLDEIIKDNPSFVALSRDEIYNNLYDLLKHRKKSENITQLFYDILDNNNERLGKLKDYTNYVFKVDAEKQDYSDLDKEDDIAQFDNLNKLNIIRHNEGKNKYFFAIKYNEDSKHMRMKPSAVINTELTNEDNADFPIYYPVFPMDDVNIPILASYYKIPIVTINDYIYAKITSHLFNNKNTNLQHSERFTSIDKLVVNTRPDIHKIVEYLKDCFDLDYANINNVFKRFGYSLDFITYADFEKLCDHMTAIASHEKERHSINRPFKIKKPDLINKKMVFFDKMNTTMKLLDLSEKSIDILQNLKLAFDDKKFNTIEKDELPQLQSLHIYDIIKDINDDKMTLEQVIDKLKSIKHQLNIDYSIKTINNLLETKQELDEIVTEYETIRDDFEYARYHTFDYDKDGKSFIVFYKEIKEILEGGNDDNYEGVPHILKNDDYEDFEDTDNVANDTQDEINVKVNELEKYWLNLRYKDEAGFVELLRILLPIINQIVAVSRISIDFDLLCSELFKHFRSITTKYNDLRKSFDEKGITLATNIVQDIAKITPYASQNVDLNMGTDIKNIIVSVNKRYIETLNDAFNMSVAWWSLYIQEKILDNSIVINENELSPIYVDRWFAYGVPVQNKERAGVLVYLCHVIIDMLKETNNYMIGQNIQKDAMNVIETVYKEKVGELRANHEVIKDKKKIEQGVIAQRIMVENIQKKKFDRIATDFINALVYMPGVNYRKIHKFLLGCCLQKIDKDFKADNDLVASGRKDLIDVKKKFATRKETNKKRYLRYFPADKKRQVEEEDLREDEIQYMKIDPYIYNIRNDNKIVEGWLDSMYDKNPLLPNDIINEIKDNSRNLVDRINKNITILKTTSRNKNSDLDTLFVIGKMNYRNILLAINKILNTHEKDDENVNKMVKVSIEGINNILPDLYRLNKVVNDEIKQDIDRINAYIVTRAMCLPSNPDLNINMILMPIMQLPQNFIEENARRIHNHVLNMLKFGKFPTMQENIDFLNKKREENKQMKLNILNNKTVEENQLISNLKKAGIKHDLMKMEMDDIKEDDEKNINDDEDVSRGEKDFELEEEEYDDDDLMEHSDMGFIYSR